MVAALCVIYHLRQTGESRYERHASKYVHKYYSSISSGNTRAGIIIRYSSRRAAEFCGPVFTFFFPRSLTTAVSDIDDGFGAITATSRAVIY